MGLTYSLFNHTRREELSFSRMFGSKLRELAGNPATASATTWYLLQNLGDRIEFIIIDFGDAPRDYTDVTDAVVDQLIEAGILRDDGVCWRDDEDPELYLRALTNVWMDDAPPGDRAPPG